MATLSHLDLCRDPCAWNGGTVLPVDGLVTAQPNITVYWRPGCGFCASLLHRLAKSDLVYSQVNIWDDDNARALVRSVASGNETVPTVVIGDQSFVNPTFATVMAEATGVRLEERRRWWRRDRSPQPR